MLYGHDAYSRELDLQLDKLTYGLFRLQGTGTGNGTVNATGTLGNSVPVSDQCSGNIPLQ